MISYSESHLARPPFDWHRYIAARNQPRINFSESFPQYLAAKGHAREWVTCACGVQCKRLPRAANGAPQDPVLYKLGNLFYTFIRVDDMHSAAETLALIEQRSAHLLDEMDRQEMALLTTATTPP